MRIDHILFNPSSSQSDIGHSLLSQTVFFQLIIPAALVTGGHAIISGDVNRLGRHESILKGANQRGNEISILGNVGQSGRHIGILGGINQRGGEASIVGSAGRSSCESGLSGSVNQSLRLVQGGSQGNAPRACSYFPFFYCLSSFEIYLFV